MDDMLSLKRRDESGCAESLRWWFFENLQCWRFFC